MSFVRRAGLAWIVSATAVALPAGAAPEEFIVESTHTYPTFAVRHLAISTQRGRFDNTRGKIRIDREAREGSIEIVIDATSISTGSPTLDAVLRSDDFFDTEKHPRITFKANALEFEGRAPKVAQGQLTLLGVSKPVTLAIEHFACTRLPLLVRTTCGADVSTTISRAAFGMSRYPTFIADEVRLNIQIEAVKLEPPVEAPLPGG